MRATRAADRHQARVPTEVRWGETWPWLHSATFSRSALAAERENYRKPTSERSRCPWQRDSAELAGDGRHVVSRPLLADLPVVCDPVDVNGIPLDAAPSRRDPKQVTVLGRRYYEPHDNEVAASNQVLLLGPQVRECPKEPGEQCGHILDAADRA